MSLRRCLSIGLAMLVTSVVVHAADSTTGTNGPRRVAQCLDERFAEGTGPFSAVRVSSDNTPSLIPADAACLDSGPSACGNRVPLDPHRQWFAGARAGNWVCVTDGTVFGWAPADQLALGPIPAAHSTDWLGEWDRRYGGADFRVKLADDRKTLHVTGTAEWRAGPDAVPHLGDLDADGHPVANELRLGEPKCLDFDYNETHEECYDCVARLMLINGRIFVIDNHLCGGMNVNFDGIYDRKPAGRRKRH
jgi:hypothetical protein